MRTIPLILILLFIIPTATADMGEPIPNLRATPPSFGTTITVPSTVSIRHVFGSVLLGPTALNAAQVDLDTGTNGQQYEQFAQPANEAGRYFTYSLTIPGGGTYRFRNVQNGVSVAYYSYVDIINETFESRAHANATWCPIINCVSTVDGALLESRSHANATWEGQAHANATWEGQAHANATWEGQGHANATWEGQAHANATWEGQAHANATWEGQGHANATWESQSHVNTTYCLISACVGSAGVSNDWFNQSFLPNAVFGNLTASNVTLMSALEVTTVWDDWADIAPWFILFLVMLYLMAWFPAIVCMFNIGAALPTPHVYGLQASIMLFVVALFLHVVVTRGVLPGSWGRKGD